MERIIMRVSASASTGRITPDGTNRNGDRDTTWPGLQVDEGDIVTFTIRLSAPPSTGTLGLTINRGGSAFNLSDLRN